MRSREQGKKKGGILADDMGLGKVRGYREWLMALGEVGKLNRNCAPVARPDRTIHSSDDRQ